ncbi:spermatogenesis-associated protein 31D3-like isoform X2 [Lemur catta]|uniref:spermatogenesis-associated protein 31D3-like isoform X2 n=1 Tax=Lemur catta TaxID=9447 RepID=UPI001E26DD24|nr:spermatogenesis-associated protein 31D3-like isoform X2 [Lemur catta]
MTPSEAEEGRKPLPSMKSPPGEYDDVVFHLHHPAHPHPACELCRRRTAEVKLSTSRESLHDAAPHSVAPFTSSVTSLSASPPGHLPPAPPPDPSPPQPLAFPRPRCHTPRADPLLQPEDTFSRKTILLFNPSLFRDIGPFPHSSPARNATDAPAYHHAPPAPSASPPPRGTLALAPFQPAPNFLHLAAASQQGAAVSLPRWGREGKAGELHRQQQPLYSETLEDDLGQRYLQLFRHLLSLHVPRLTWLSQSSKVCAPISVLPEDFSLGSELQNTIGLRRHPRLIQHLPLPWVSLTAKSSERNF